MRLVSINVIISDFLCFYRIVHLGTLSTSGESANLTVVQPSVFIETPNYPANYGPNEDVIWTIYPDTRCRGLDIIFLPPTFDVIANKRGKCAGSADSVTIYFTACDGTDDFEMVCGNAIDLNADPNFGQLKTNSSDPVILNFVSGRNKEGTGFKAEVCCRT